jgi:hypothetical protein
VFWCLRVHNLSIAGRDLLLCVKRLGETKNLVYCTFLTTVYTNVNKGQEQNAAVITTASRDAM